MKNNIITYNEEVESIIPEKPVGINPVKDSLTTDKSDNFSAITSDKSDNTGNKCLKSIVDSLSSSMPISIGLISSLLLPLL